MNLLNINVIPRMLTLVVAFVLSVPSAALGQLVCVSGGCGCDGEELPDANLSVSHAVHVTGRLVDETGFPFVFENSIIQIRTAKERSVLFTVKVDRTGKFDLGIVPAGNYRLIAARRWENGKLSRQPLADQPKPMACAGDSDCSITAIQHIHGTDMPYEGCPPM